MDDYGFSDDYPLQEKLDEALFWYAAYRERKPTARSQHKKLDTLSKRAIKLLDAIADLDGEDFANLESYYPLLSERENINGTLRAIRNAAEFAENDIPKGKAGKPENIALHGFIRRLNRIFTEGTGKQR